jgi:hypothetical protein
MQHGKHQKLAQPVPRKIATAEQCCLISFTGTTTALIGGWVLNPELSKRI